ncbi:MAG: hypothetical protein HOJ74_10255 [Gemmatimonadales bacterium]|nr:hypothetical protein [Gemmatimonadales bacterium]
MNPSTEPITEVPLASAIKGHVDTTTALHIVAYVQSPSVDPVGRFQRVFHPGGAQLQSDMDFAMNLFGDDQWPETLSSADLPIEQLDQVTRAVGVPGRRVAQRKDPVAAVRGGRRKVRDRIGRDLRRQASVARRRLRRRDLRLASHRFTRTT